MPGKILLPLLFLLVVGSACSDKLAETNFDTTTYQKDLQSFYDEGLIDSAQLVRTKNYISRAIYIEESVKDEQYARLDHPELFAALASSRENPLTYRKLIDSSSLATKSWPGKKITRAVAISFYTTDSVEARPFIPKDTSVKYNDDYNLNDYTLTPNLIQRELTPAEIQELLNALNGYLPPGSYVSEGTADCFMPYNGIILYGEKGEYVSYIEICFGCNGFRVHPQSLRSWGEKSRLKEMKIDNYVWTMRPFRKVFGVPYREGE